ncbi:MAG TPA: galactose-1-phosphate uridylyltransferase [Candidatus Komeilibacteria bacterium]|nr:galactose-1-phosphate uridylyltransferase [Candidatus Komeilibacteria bacterium]
MPKKINPEIRKDYIQDKYVIIAPVRAKRPYNLERPQQKKPAKAKDCIFCPRQVDNVNDRLTLYKKNRQDWWVKIIPNKYPAVGYNYPQAYGCQDVVIETPEHQPELEDLSIAHISKILEAYSSRTSEISRDPKIEYILIFKNNGGKAGASVDHAHSQIFATQFLPPHLIDKSQKQQKYKLKTGHCIYCDVINKEKKGPRWIGEDKDIVCFTPYASMHHYEAWIMPKRHIDNITQLTDSERESFAKFLKHLVKKIGRLGLPYNFYFHQVINDEDQHLYLKIKPRGNIWAGVEIGSGLIINPVTPEAAAAYYSQGLK